MIEINKKEIKQFISIYNPYFTILTLLISIITLAFLSTLNYNIIVDALSISISILSLYVTIRIAQSQDKLQEILFEKSNKARVVVQDFTVDAYKIDKNKGKFLQGITPVFVPFTVESSSITDFEMKATIEYDEDVIKRMHDYFSNIDTFPKFKYRVDNGISFLEFLNNDGFEGRIRKDESIVSSHDLYGESMLGNIYSMRIHTDLTQLMEFYMYWIELQLDELYIKSKETDEYVPIQEISSMRYTPPGLLLSVKYWDVSLNKKIENEWIINFRPVNTMRSGVDVFRAYPKKITERHIITNNNIGGED